MTGQQPIIALRMAKRPIPGGCIWVKTDLPAVPMQFHDDHAEVGIERTDYPDLLDTRFAVGLTVIVEGADADRVASVGKAFERHAGRVLTTVFDRKPLPESVSIGDTSGVLTWPK